MKRKIAIAVGFVIALIALAFFVDSLPHPRPKEFAIDVRELIPTRIEIPVESNGFSLLIEAGKLLTVSGDEPIFEGGTNWDQAEAQNILAANKDAVVAMHKAWSLPYLQVEPITNFAQQFDYWGNWRNFARLGIMEARVTFEVTNEETGFAQAMNVVRFGQLVEGAGGVEVHYLVGVAIKSTGLQAIRDFSERTTLTPGDLVALSEQLTNFEADPNSFRETLKVEYTRHAIMFDELESEKESNSPFYMRFVFNGTKSKQELAAETLCTMQAITNCYAAGISYIPMANTNRSYISRLAGGNMIGSMLNDMNLESRGGILARKCRENVDVRATRIILALRAYEMVNHKPADSLSDLVPTFIKTIPLDDFDSKPMRYSKSLKEVYSVGEDLIDSGGIKGTNWHTGDIVFPFNF